MTSFLLQPGLYSTDDRETLFDLLDELWPKHPNGQGSFYLVSGFGTHNGGLRFFERFRRQTVQGGTVEAVLSGSPNRNHSSQQLAEALLDCGVRVTVVRRNRMMHAKLYGLSDASGESLVVTSGNFTSPGIKQNIEAAVYLSPAETKGMGFSSADMLQSFATNGLDAHLLSPDKDDPVWSWLYDEDSRTPFTPETSKEEVEAMVLTLSHSDTARIQAAPGTNASRGTQYFWLAKDSYEFFPPLDSRSSTRKVTYSTLITINYLDIGVTQDSRVTFEAENNLDFRLGTGPLRGTKVAQQHDLAVIVPRGGREYDLKIVPQGATHYWALRRYAVNQVGNKGKVAGYAPLSVVEPALT